IERYHRSMKNRVLLDNYYLPGQLEHSIEEFVSYYNNCRYHESLDNLTPADVYFGRGQVILERRENIKLKTIEQTPHLHTHPIAALTFKRDEPDILLNCQADCPKCSDDIHEAARTSLPIPLSKIPLIDPGARRQRWHTNQIALHLGSWWSLRWRRSF